MKKFIISILIITLYSSCTKVYNLRERLTLDANVISENDVALGSVNVDIFADGYYSIFYPEESQGSNIKTQPFEVENDLISFSETDTEGKARLHFPSAGGSIENSDYKVVFSKDEDDFKPLEVFIQGEDFQDYYFQIPTQKIYRFEVLTQLLITTELDDNYRLDSFSLTGKIAYDFITTDEISNPKKFTNEDIIDVEKNQSIQLNYSLTNFEGGTSSVINEEVLIVIGNENVTYVIQNP